MSGDTDISSRELPVGEASLEDGDKDLGDMTKVTTGSSGGGDAAPEGTDISPKPQAKKKKNKRRKGHKENGVVQHEDSNPQEKETLQTNLDPKDDKTKLNMERQKQDKNQKVDSDGSSEPAEKEEDTAVAEEEDDLSDLSNSEQMDGGARNKVYQRGLEYFNKGKKSSALTCFMACLTGLADKEGFSFLPQCLKHMADIYYGREEYEKAIQFIQAEKMYYETALINTTGLQKKLEENLKEKKSPEEGAGTSSAEDAEPDAGRADEYENLAKLCLEQKQAELALEYQGKATKLRQQLYGAEHPLTKKSLDFFTVVYAEVGKQQYTESLQKFSEKPPEVSSVPPQEGEGGQRLGRRPSGILRSPSEESKNKDRHVRFQEPEPRNDIQQQEEWVSRGILWVLFGVCIAVLTCLLLYLYCRMDPGSSTCATWRSQSNYYYMRAKYLYYTWNSRPGANKFG